MALDEAVFWLHMPSALQAAVRGAELHLTSTLTGSCMHLAPVVSCGECSCLSLSGGGRIVPFALHGGVVTCWGGLF